MMHNTLVSKENNHHFGFDMHLASFFQLTAWNKISSVLISA
jgi:hypothetical protein